MMEARGFVILDSDEKQMVVQKDNGQFIYIFFYIDSKIGISNVKEYLQNCYQNSISHLIIIYRKDISPPAKKVLENIDNIKTELFRLDELQFNILTHDLVPSKFAKMSPNNSKAFFTRFAANTLPLMLKTDPISRFYGYEKGDLIEIHRKDGIVSYRLVV